MIAGPSGPCGGCPTEPKPRQIQFSDETINDADQTVFADPVFQPVREKHRLAPTNALDKSHNAHPRCPAEVYHKRQFPNSLGPLPLRLCVNTTSYHGINLGSRGTDRCGHAREAKENFS